MNKKERIILILLAALNFTHIMDFMIMMPLSNFLIPYFKISAQQFSMLVAAYAISAAIASFTASSFVDKYDRKKVLIFANTGFLIGTLLCALSPNYWLLLCARIVAGLFGGLIGAQVLSIVADLVPFERRGIAMGIIMSAFSAASAFGVPFGLYLSKFLNWHAPFYFVVIIGALLMPLLLKYIPNVTSHINNQNPQKKNPLILLKEIVLDKNQSLAVSLMAMMMMGHFVIIPFLFPFLEFNMGFSKTVTPLVYVVGGGLTLFTSTIVGRLADKYGKFSVFSVMILLALIPILFITNMPHIPFYFVLCVTGFWFVVSTGRAIPAQAIVSEIVPPARRGSFMSISAAIQQMAVGLASVIAGLVVVKMPDNSIKNYNITGFISIALILSCLLIGIRLKKAISQKTNKDDSGIKEEVVISSIEKESTMPQQATA